MQVIFFLKHGAHTTLLNFKIGLTNDLKSGTIISFVLNLNVNCNARSYRSAILFAFLTVSFICCSNCRSLSIKTL